MASYTPGAEVVDDRKTFSLYDTVTAAFVDFDFSSAGYAQDDPLDDLTKGEVRFYASFDPNFEIFADLMITGINTEADGIIMFRSTTNTGAYIAYNLPDSRGVTLFCKAILRKTDDVSHCTIYWQNDTNG